MPLKLVFVSESTAAAAETFCTFCTVVRAESAITVAPRVGSRREVLTLRLPPASVPALAPKSKRPPPPGWPVAVAAVAGSLTVMSVPTP